MKNISRHYKRWLLALLLLMVLHHGFAQDLTSCLQDPSQNSCINVEYPDSQAANDVKDLCSQMDFMAGCSIWQYCQKSQDLGAYCSNWSILQDICLVDQDMSRMRGCNGYNQLCSNAQYANRTTVVKQCKSQGPLPNIPTTGKLAAQVKSICSEMSMSGCEQCTGQGEYPQCDILKVYSNLCLQMPGMSQCSDWSKMCQTIPSSSMCLQGNSEAPPTMKMYFHLGISDYILFESWVPRTVGAFVGSCIAVFLFGFALEGLDVVGLYLERRWAEAERLRLEKSPVKMVKKDDATDSTSSQEINNLYVLLPLMGPEYWTTGLWIDIQRFFFTFVIRGWGYIVMLVTMIFNVWLFLSVVAGLAFGSVFFWRMRVFALTGFRRKDLGLVVGNGELRDEDVVQALTDVARYGGGQRCC